MNDDWKNFEPRRNAPIVATTQQPSAAPEVDINDAGVLREFSRKELIHAINCNRGSLGVVPAIRELLDRLDGKPAQAVNLNANLNVVTVNANISFIPVERDKVIDGDVDNVQVIDNKG